MTSRDQSLELGPPGVQGRPLESTPLFFAFGVQAPRRFNDVTVIDAVIDFVNGDITPAGPADRVQDVRAFAGDMLTAAAKRVEVIESEGDIEVMEDGNKRIKVTTFSLSGMGQLMGWIARHGVDENPVYGQLGFKHSWRRTSREPSSGSQIEWQLAGPNNPEPWIKFAAMALADRAGGRPTESDVVNSVDGSSE